MSLGTRALAVTAHLSLWVFATLLWAAPCWAAVGVNPAKSGLVCFAYWPWDCHGGRQMRKKRRDKRAVLVTSAAMPVFFIPFFTGALRALKLIATTLGAKPVARVVVGLAGDSQTPSVSVRALHRARAAGRSLVSG